MIPRDLLRGCNTRERLRGPLVRHAEGRSRGWGVSGPGRRAKGADRNGPSQDCLICSMLNRTAEVFCNRKRRALNEWTRPAQSFDPPF
jgi:hypothetical protein